MRYQLCISKGKIFLHFFCYSHFECASWMNRYRAWFVDDYDIIIYMEQSDWTI